MVGRWSWYWVHVYYTSRITYIKLHRSFQAIIQSYQFLVHTYSNSYLPFFTTSCIDAQPRTVLIDHLYVCTITLALLWAYLHYNSIFKQLNICIPEVRQTPVVRRIPVKYVIAIPACCAESGSSKYSCVLLIIKDLEGGAALSGFEIIKFCLLHNVYRHQPSGIVMPYIVL